MHESDWAAEHLQTIRTLMERSALYRRALAPIMIYNGVLGIAGGASGQIWNIESVRGFISLWAVVAVLALVGSFLLVRRQALKDSEPFWSPPTRRVAYAMLPALTIGLFIGVTAILTGGSDKKWVWVASLVWCTTYGCALHAAGSFMQRGIKLLGWLFILAGCGFMLAPMFISASSEHPSPLSVLFDTRGMFMGIMFGGVHLAYGIYLYFTEKRGNES